MKPKAIKHFDFHLKALIQNHNYFHNHPKFLEPILPKSLRINHPAQIAKAILEAALAQEKGVKIISSKELHGSGTL